MWRTSGRTVLQTPSLLTLSMSKSRCWELSIPSFECSQMIGNCSTRRSLIWLLIWQQRQCRTSATSHCIECYPSCSSPFCKESRTRIGSLSSRSYSATTPRYSPRFSVQSIFSSAVASMPRSNSCISDTSTFISMLSAKHSAQTYTWSNSSSEWGSFRDLMLWISSWQTALRVKRWPIGSYLVVKIYLPVTKIS